MESLRESSVSSSSEFSERGHNPDADDPLLENIELGKEKLSGKLDEKRRGGLRLSLTVHTLLLAIYATIWITIVKPQTSPRPFGVNLITSPAREAVKYEASIFKNDLEDVNEFMGEPSPRLDAAWDNILKYRNSAVPWSSLGIKDTGPVSLYDGSDRTIITLDVFHSLYCLNMLRQFIYKDYYQTEGDEATRAEKVVMCVNDIRVALMCHGDIAIGTYVWKEGYPRPWPDFHIEHECRNWDSIFEWAKANTVDLYGVRLQHPVYGVLDADVIGDVY